jgi:hypothetical protein
MNPKQQAEKDTEEVYIFELIFMGEKIAKRIAKEIFEKTGHLGNLYKTKLPKEEIMISFK